MGVGTPRFTRRFNTLPLRQKLEYKVQERIEEFNRAKDIQNKSDIKTYDNPFKSYLQIGREGDPDRIVFEWMLHRNEKQTFVYTYSFTVGGLRSANLNEIADKIINKVIECLDDFE